MPVATRTRTAAKSAAPKVETPAVPPRVIRDAEFARRLESACDGHPHAPEKHRGRLMWLKTQLEQRFDESVSVETCRKWFAGEARPRPDKMAKLAQLLEVDVAWLSMGIDPDMQPRERKARNAMADGAVNLVAGFIQMDGGYPAFPEEKDKRAQKDNIDLYAIIKGANYSLHVSLGEKEGRDLRFVVPTNHENVVVLGVVRDGFKVQIFEMDADMIETLGTKRGGSIEVVVAPDYAAMKRIDSFRDRL